jgi:hypothetical protein
MASKHGDDNFVAVFCYLYMVGDWKNQESGIGLEQACSAVTFCHSMHFAFL